MTRYLLDTNILSDAMKRPFGPVAERMNAEAEESLVLSAIVLAELRFGARRISSTQIEMRIDALESQLQVLPFGPPADQAYADIRTDLQRRGVVIGANDLLIAAQAVAADMILVTDNVGEFGRVAGLRVENWLRLDP